MRISDQFSEWTNFIEVLDRVSLASNIPQLTGAELSGITAFADRMSNLTSASEMAMRNIELISKPMEMMYTPPAELEGIKSVVSQMGTISSAYDSFRMTENLGNTLSMISSLAGQLSMPSDHFSGILAASQALHDRMAFVDSLGLDQTRLTSAVGLVLQRVYESKEYEIEDISPLVAECYEPETEEEKETLKAIVAPTGTKERTEKQKLFSATVLSIVLFLLSPFYAHITDAVMQRVTKDNPPVINQYYIQNITNNIAVEGYDVGILNVWGYRIVNREIILRARPGQSSYVTGHLPKGKIVRVIGKYRKWVEVTWRDENGEVHFGWIQNYKLSTFSD